MLFLKILLWFYLGSCLFFGTYVLYLIATDVEFRKGRLRHKIEVFLLFTFTGWYWVIEGIIDTIKERREKVTE